MSSSRCHICNRKLGLYTTGSQIYCDKSIRDCWKIGKEASQRNIRAKMKLEVILAGKECKRCKKHVYEAGMRTYCTECKDIMEDTGGYVKKKKPTTMKCIECNKDTPWKLHKKYCSKCKLIVVERNIKNSTKRIAVETKKLKEENKKTQNHKKRIDPKWLSRNYQG